MSELKPCPFCGGEISKSVMSIAPITVYDCKNTKCGACVSFKAPNDYQPKDTDSHWNNRPNGWIEMIVGENEEGIEVYDCPLPDEEQEVLVTDRTEIWTDTFMYDSDGCYFDRGGSIDGNVTHWQPLPEPPKEVE